MLNTTITILLSLSTGLTVLKDVSNIHIAILEYYIFSFTNMLNRINKFIHYLYWCSLLLLFIGLCANPLLFLSYTLFTLAFILFITVLLFKTFRKIWHRFLYYHTRNNKKSFFYSLLLILFICSIFFFFIVLVYINEIVFMSPWPNQGSSSGSGSGYGSNWPQGSVGFPQGSGGGPQGSGGGPQGSGGGPYGLLGSQQSGNNEDDGSIGWIWDSEQKAADDARVREEVIEERDKQRLARAKAVEHVNKDEKYASYMQQHHPNKSWADLSKQQRWDMARKYRKNKPKYTKPDMDEKYASYMQRDYPDLKWAQLDTHLKQRISHEYMRKGPIAKPR